MKVCPECGGKNGMHKDGCSKSKGKCEYCGYSLQSHRHAKDCPCFDQEKEDARLAKYEESCMKNLGVKHNYFLQGHQEKMCLAANKSDKTVHISKLNRRIADKLKDRGAKVELEYEYLDHFFDIHAHYKDKEVLIERNPTVTHNADIDYLYYRGMLKTNKGGLEIDYHNDLSNQCLIKGIDLIQWFDWYNDRKMIGLILKKLDLVEEIDGYECELKKVDKTTANKFLRRYSLSPIICATNEQALGLYWCDTPVAILTHRKGRVTNYAELDNFKVLHGLELLVRHVQKSYEVRVKTDFNLTYGKELVDLGAKRTKAAKPHLVHVIPNRKAHIAHEDLNDMDKILARQVRQYAKKTQGKTHDEILRDLNFVRVFDCGYDEWYLKRIRD